MLRNIKCRAFSRQRILEFGFKKKIVDPYSFSHTRKYAKTNFPLLSHICMVFNDLRFRRIVQELASRALQSELSKIKSMYGKSAIHYFFTKLNREPKVSSSSALICLKDDDNCEITRDLPCSPDKTTKKEND